MKLKFVAAAAAVLCGANAFAAINTIDGDAELFVMVWDEGRATYVKDLGLTLGALTTQGIAKNWTFSVSDSPNFAGYVAEDTATIGGVTGSLFDFSATGGTRWALFAVDSNNNFQFDGKDLNYLTTTTFDAKMPTSRELVNTALESMRTFAETQQQFGLGTDVTKNNDSFNKKGTDGHFIETNFGGNAGIFAGNAIGDGVAKLSFCSWDNITEDVMCPSKNSAGLNLQASFDGGTFAVSAVPEPTTYALLLAGFATVVAAARRRKA